MKRFFVLLFLVVCSCDSSSSSGSAIAATPSASSIAPATPPPSASTAPSATAAPTSTVKPTAPAPASLPFCKSSLGAEPLAALCATGEDWSKAHFECAKPLPRNFCGELVVWGCQYIASAGEKTPKVTFDARFVRGGVAPEPGEIIDDNSLRARFPRAGNVRGVTVRTIVASDDEGSKLSAAETKKLVDAGCVTSGPDKPGSTRLECGGWQARVSYDDANKTVSVDADTPKAPDCAK